MSGTYTIRYRLRGQWFWRKLKRVKDDMIIYGRKEDLPQPNGTFITAGFDPLYRSIIDDEDNIHVIPLDAEMVFPKERQACLSRRLRKESGGL